MIVTCLNCKSQNVKKLDLPELGYQCRDCSAYFTNGSSTLFKIMYEDLEKSYPGKMIRQFETGATRDTDAGKLDYEGFLSPLVLKRYAEYMHKNRVQADGTLRDSDNWQKGIPIAQYMKSMWRHMMDVWSIHRGVKEADIEEALCAVMFNAMGMLFEVIKTKEAK